MELTVTVTLSDRLFGLLENKLPNLGRRVEKAITKEIGAQTRKESNIDITVSSKPAADETPEPVEAPKQDADDKPEPVAPAPPAPKPTAPTLTPAERIREIMHRTRQRFEGEDYKGNTTSENYKKFHKQLTSQFKQIALVLGADKPSTLPDDKVENFAAECEALIIGEDGNITPPPAPY